MTVTNRQGDVYIQRVDKEITGEVVKQVTVAYGEVSGHHHTVLPVDKKTKIEIAQEGEYIYAKITGGKAALFHGNDQEIEEVRSGKTLDWAKVDVHAPQYLEPGVYRFFVQTEYDPQTYRRKVLD